MVDDRRSRIGVLISGRGSNMQAIVRACGNGEIPADAALVVSNKASAPGLEWAADQGLPTACISHKEFDRREDHDRAVLAVLREAGAEWVCLAGYMRLLSPVFVEAYRHRLLNIHPSLLPAFPGLDAQAQALEWGVRVSGCTVHLVDEELDHGPIVVQRTVRVMDGDTEDSLSARILEQEHLAYPEALRLLLTGAWRVSGRRIIWGNATPS